MIEDKPSVCISFEPRDEAAAQRVASALREAGIAVVLGSEAGVAAVEDCDLFLPIVSDNTQTQSAGRFRAEWQRAASRAEAMADNATFLLPVVVDNTANREAKVPAVFRGRPWMHFDVWGPTAALVSRVEAMLEKRSAARAQAAAEQEAQAEALARSFFRRWVKRLPAWVRRLKLVWVFTFVVLPGGVIAFRVQQKQAEDEGSPPIAVPEPAQPTPSASEGGAAVAAKGALPSLAGGLDSGAAKVDSTEIANLAKYSKDGDEEAPSQSWSKPSWSPTDEAVDHRAKQPWLPQPVERKAGAAGRPVAVAEQAAMVERLATERWQRGGGVYAGGTSVGGTSQEATDPAMDEAAMDSRPERPAAPDWLQATLAALWSGQPAEALQDLADVNPKAWWDEEAFRGPVALLEGVCWMARTGDTGLHAASRARQAWQRALAAVTARRTVQPDDVTLDLVEAQVRVLLGDEVGALEALRRWDDSVVGRKAGPQREHLIVWATLGDTASLMEEAILRFRAGKARWSEVHDWLRYDPRFAAWRAQVGLEQSAPADL